MLNFNLTFTLEFDRNSKTLILGFPNTIHQHPDALGIVNSFWSVYSREIVGDKFVLTREYMIEFTRIVEAGLGRLLSSAFHHGMVDNLFTVEIVPVWHEPITTLPKNRRPNRTTPLKKIEPKKADLRTK